MATKSTRGNLKTDTNVSSQKKNISRTTFTSARKFFAKDQVTNNSDVPVEKTNTSHIINDAESLQMMANVTSVIAKNAQRDLTTVRDQLAKIKGKKSENERSSSPSFSENDIGVSQRKKSQDVINSTVSTGRVKKKIVEGTKPFLENSLSNFLPVNKQAKSGPVTNTSIPLIDHVSILFDKKTGSVDSFFSRIKFSLVESDVTSGNVRAIRIFRSSIESPSTSKIPGKLSLRGVDRIQSNRRGSRTKNQDYTSDIEKRLTEGGVDNTVSSLMRLDPFTNMRLGKSDADSSVKNKHFSDSRSLNYKVADDLSSFVAIQGNFDGIDLSVASNLNALRNIQKQNPDFTSLFLSREQSVTRKTQKPKIVGIPVVDSNNSQEFREIVTLTPDKTGGEIVGRFIEYTFDDSSVMYGHGYRYYLVTVDDNMNESVRSRIVQITIDGNRIPSPPSSVSPNVTDQGISLGILADDSLIEKFEIFRKDAGIDPPSEKIDIVTISSADGFPTKAETREFQQNGFLQIGDALHGDSFGSIFFDRNVKPGRSYVYRIYSVDIFGNKSESPRELFLNFPDKKSVVKLMKPTLLVEIDSTTNKCGITMKCEDERVTNLYLSRKDLSIYQTAFTTPGDTNIIKIGVMSRHPRNLEDSHLIDGSKELCWSGIFKNTGENIRFVDFTSRIDHTYQYQVYGTDRFGNMTSAEMSDKVFVSRRPVLNAPGNLSAKLRTNESGSILGVDVSWENGDIDLTSESRLGNRSTFTDNSVKTLYQLERRGVNEEIWRDYPMIEEQSFFDPSPIFSGPDAPKFRPSFVQQNRKYLYRVQSFQSGGFISNFSDPVSISITTPLFSPVNFHVAPSDTKVRPFYVKLSWDDPLTTGVVDRWEIQRAAVNNFAAARLSFKSSADLKNLDFKSFKIVYRESSRSNSQSTDRARVLNSSGHQFCDFTTLFGNSYYYRIRAVGIDGNEFSDWVYRGAKITDDVFEMKQRSVLNQDDVQKLSIDMSPFSFNENADEKSSFSLNPVDNSLTWKRFSREAIK